MAELTTTPPRAVTHPLAPPKPVDAIIHGSRLEFDIEDGHVVMRLSDTSRLVMRPMAALAIATLLVRNARKAEPSCFGDERTTLARMLREANAQPAASSSSAPAPPAAPVAEVG